MNPAGICQGGCACQQAAVCLPWEMQSLHFVSWMAEMSMCPTNAAAPGPLCPKHIYPVSFSGVILLGFAYSAVSHLVIMPFVSKCPTSASLVVALWSSVYIISRQPLVFCRWCNEHIQRCYYVYIYCKHCQVAILQGFHLQKRPIMNDSIQASQA